MIWCYTQNHCANSGTAPCETWRQCQACTESLREKVEQLHVRRDVSARPARNHCERKSNSSMCDVTSVPALHRITARDSETAPCETWRQCPVCRLSPGVAGRPPGVRADVARSPCPVTAAARNSPRTHTGERRQRGRTAAADPCRRTASRLPPPTAAGTPPFPGHSWHHRLGNTSNLET